MSPLKNKWSNVSSFLFVLVLIFFALPTFAQDNNAAPLTSLSAQSILVNLAQQVPNLMRLVTAIAYVLGMYFIIAGIIKLKHAGEMRTQMSQEHSLAGPLIYIAIGAMLLYLPSTVQIGLSTFWTNPNPYGYVNQQDQWSQFTNVVYIIVQFIGVLAFIRGLIILSHLSGHGGQPGTFARGLTHIIGGILCVNLYQFVQVIMNTLGIET